MKLVFVIDQVYLHGGIERVLSIKANYFASKPGYSVHILTTEQKKNINSYNFNDKIIFKDLEINYNRKKSYYNPINLIKLPQHYWRLKSEIKKIKPDIIVVSSHSTDTYFIPFIYKNIPKIKEFHFTKHIEIKTRNSSKITLKKFFYKFTDYVEKKYTQLVVLNHDELKYYKSTNTRVIPNALTFFPNNISDGSNKIVIAAGRIAHVKGFDILIDIWNLIYQKNKEWQLHIYGGGELNYTKLLQSKINKYGLEKVVFLKGSTSDIQEKMIDASIFAMTSHNECFPLVLLEAQACGLPIISFNCPNGPRNIITGDSGVLVPQYNNSKFSEELIILMENNKVLKEMGSKARLNASKFNLNIVMELWEKLFVDIR